MAKSESFIGIAQSCVTVHRVPVVTTVNLPTKIMESFVKVHPCDGSDVSLQERDSI